ASGIATRAIFAGRSGVPSRGSRVGRSKTSGTPIVGRGGGAAGPVRSAGGAGRARAGAGGAAVSCDRAGAGCRRPTGASPGPGVAGVARVVRGGRGGRGGRGRRCDGSGE